MISNEVEKRTNELLETITSFQKAFKDKDDSLIYKFIKDEPDLKERLGLSDVELVNLLKPNVIKFIESKGNFHVVEDLSDLNEVKVVIGDWYGAYTLYSIKILDLSGEYLSGNDSKKLQCRIDKLNEQSKEDIIKDIENDLDVESQVIEYEEHRISILKDKIKDDNKARDILLSKESDLFEKLKNTVLGKKKIQSELDSVKFEIGVLDEDLYKNKLKLKELKEAEKSKLNKVNPDDFTDIINQAKVNIVLDDATLNAVKGAGFKSIEDLSNWIFNFRENYLSSYKKDATKSKDIKVVKK